MERGEFLLKKGLIRCIIIIEIILNVHPAIAGKISKRKIELEWESQPEAVKYEVEIYNADGKSLMKSYTVPDALFKATLPVGNYQFRSRYSTKTGQQSPWSELEFLDVTVPAGNIKMEETGSYHQVDLKAHRAPVSFHWDMIKGIKEYKLDLLSKSGALMNSYRVSAAPFKIDLSEGEYRYLVTPIDEYGNKGDPSESSAPILVTRAQLPPPEVSLQEANNKIHWKIFSGSQLAGTLYHRRIFSSEWRVVEKYAKIKTSPWIPPLHLAPGEYEMVMSAYIDHADPSEGRSVFFKVKPRKPTLQEFLGKVESAP